MKKMILAAAVTLGLLTAWPAAQAGDIDLSIGIGIPGLMFGGPPVYYAPPTPSACRRGAATYLCVSATTILL
ncbi:hypothetical protein [Castellaniella sp.]|uniref:hypothetical protein n=1 Tax=Castellaniella sp. TaxID=1955812 RepID=UPI002AFEA4FA|nr:hypothetical protein [Castellaniella sp.]